MCLLWFTTFLVGQRMAAPFFSIQAYLLCVTVFELAVSDKILSCNFLIPALLLCLALSVWKKKIG